MVHQSDTPPVPFVPPAEGIRTQGRDGEEGVRRLGGSVDPMHQHHAEKTVTTRK